MLVDDDAENKSYFTMAYKISLLVGVLVLITTVSVSTWIFKRSEAELIKHKIEELNNEVNLQSIRFKAYKSELLRDTLFLSGTPPIQGIIRTQSNAVDYHDGSSTLYDWELRLQSIFMQMLNAKPYYLQIRYIGLADGGRELVRVDRMGESGTIRVVTGDELQQKGDTEYFKNALRVNRGTPTLSEINLNKEYGEISEPHVPVIRSSIAIFDENNNAFGILVINKDITVDMKLLSNIYDPSSTLIITNSKGDYLYHPDKEKTYRFEFGESIRLQDDYPEFKEAFKYNIETDEAILHKNNNGMVDILSLRKINYDPNNPQKIIGFVMKEDSEQVLAVSNQIRKQASLIFLVFIIIVAGIGFLFAQRLSRPILKITDGIRQFSAGGQQVEFPVESKGEAGLLARAFAELIDNVRDREASLKIEVEERNKAEQQIKAVLDSAVDAILTIDKTGTILTANDAATHIFGYAKSEILGRNVKMLMPEHYSKEHDGYLDNYHRTGEKKALGGRREVTGLRKDGSIFPMTLSVSEVNVEGEVTYTGIVRDISAEKQAEAKIKEALHFNELIMRNIPDMVFIKDSNLRIVQANSAFLNVYPEAERDSVIGTTTMEQYDEKETEKFLADDRKALKEGYIETEETVHFPDGRTRTLFTKKVRFENVKGEKFILGLGHDISLRKEAEKSLIEYNRNIEYQKNYYESLISNLNVPAFILNPDHEVIIWNKACEELTGIQAEEVLGTTNHWLGFYESKRPLLADIVLDGSYDVINDLYGKEVENSFIKGGRQIENWCPMPKKGKQLYLAIDAGPIYDKDGNVIAVTEVLKDITSIKQTQEKLVSHQQELERSNKELERFAYIASHDLQEPLRMVSSYTQLLAKRYKDKLDEDANVYINFAVDGALRMQSLIQDLLKYSRLSSESRELVEIDANELFDDAVQNLEILIDETGSIVTKDELPVITGDVGQLRQLFQDLIGNAIKYRDADKTNKVHVSALESNDGWQFCIEDNGIGIAPEYFEKIFVIFKRLHGNAEYKGTGIGLALCKRIVEFHGGKIWVESEPDTGSKFYFSLLNSRIRASLEDEAVEQLQNVM